MAPSMIGGVRMPAAAGEKKKVRKPYTITRPRERWTADEHDRFLHALQLFGRDWKRIEAFVGTKTTVQIRSHAQKHFLKAHKFGLLPSCLPPPPLHPRRAAVLPLQQQQPVSLHASSGAADAATLPIRSPMGCTSSRGQQPDASQDEAIDHLPLSPDDLRFSQVYRFVGDVFGSGAPRPVEANLWRLQGMDPVVVETILMVLTNLEAKLHA